MPSRLLHLVPADYVVSQWSGGSTTQIAISPDGAKYADRDFLWRLSSATVELDESDFTPLPDYRRFIAPLRGEMRLSHNGGAVIALAPCQIHAFDGGDATHSWGRCVDFNLMLRKGKCQGAVETARPSGGAPLALTSPLGPEAALLLYCVEGGGTLSAGEETISLRPGETACLKRAGEAALSLSGSDAGVFMAAWVKS